MKIGAGFYTEIALELSQSKNEIHRHHVLSTTGWSFEAIVIPVVTLEMVERNIYVKVMCPSCHKHLHRTETAIYKLVSVCAFDVLLH